MDRSEDHRGRWTVHGERTLYGSPWVRLGKADITTPSGNRFEHHTVTLPSAAVIAILSQAGEHVLMSYRHRFVPDVWGWELPGGLLDPDETPEQAVVREALEETGYRIGSVEHVVTFEPMVGTVRSPHHVFIGRNAHLAADPTEFDEGVYEWIPLAKARKLIAQGQVQSSGTLIALLHLLAS
ncbi:NUDIX hydrolase [Nocardiopsis algeriensis]|uniref:8-oxo-dGTP pyrophosphatase MutT (NUDIX family) n=1 Tax=Nocardiopsis algeriensis TaxID=1478215 RepID=A0A841IT95_9ACTN|nr:NUDIX hydrolase [Nocardiopsis algeriensis]MBB6119481.1 8-oxo-dGTP pyrophosphatase MutT (NUDIX family) [Nocardiopsis algeriensis]